MAEYVKMAGHVDRHTNWTSEVVLERDDDGNVTKSVQAGVPVQLSADDRKKLDEMGFTFEKSSKEEADEYAAQAGFVQAVGADIRGSAPVFENAQAGAANQTDQPSGSGDKK